MRHDEEMEPEKGGGRSYFKKKKIKTDKDKYQDLMMSFVFTKSNLFISFLISTFFIFCVFSAAVTLYGSCVFLDFSVTNPL